MLGAIIGDIVGSRFEFNNHRSKDFELFTDECRFTDDTVMTIAIAKAIMETAKNHNLSRCMQDHHVESALSKLSVKYMQEIGRNYPHCGYGGMFKHWMFSNNPEPYDSYGNGAAMRVSPAGFVGNDRWEAEEIAEIVTAVTHDHEEGIKGAKATAVAICMARNGSAIDEIREHISREYYALDFKIDDIRASYLFNETCQDTVPQAIECFLESSSFEDAIRIAISLGGDSDTIGAITGAIAEAYYGVPDDIKNKALGYLDERLRLIYDEWEKFTGLKDINDIIEISLDIGGFHQGRNNLCYTFNPDGAVYTSAPLYEYKDSSVLSRFSPKDTEKLRNSFADIHIELWKSEYTPIGYMVLDGEQWELSIRYKDGYVKKYTGDNAYPDNWNMLLDFFDLEKQPISEPMSIQERWATDPPPKSYTQEEWDAKMEAIKQSKENARHMKEHETDN